MNSKRSAAFFVLFLFFASTSWAQTAIQPGTIVGTFQGAQYFSANSAILLTVPGDRNARVTDVHVTNYNGIFCAGYLVFGGTAYSFIVAPNSTLVVPLVSGFGVPANNVISTGGVNCPSANSVYAIIRGFYFTLP